VEAKLEHSHTSEGIRTRLAQDLHISYHGDPVGR
jgi:hypothetical protein